MTPGLRLMAVHAHPDDESSKGAASMARYAAEGAEVMVVSCTGGERGGYPHPDHVMCHTVSMSAFRAAGDAAAYPHAGEPWQPLKIYYSQTFSKAMLVAYHDAMESAGLESPYGEWLKNWEDRPERTVTTRVPCADFFGVRDRALLAHATQVDPEGSWFKVPVEMRRTVWPTEDYELALSYLPVTLPEDDLFAGLGSVDDADKADTMARSGELRIAYDGTTAVPADPQEVAAGALTSDSNDPPSAKDVANATPEDELGVS